MPVRGETPGPYKEPILARSPVEPPSPTVKPSIDTSGVTSTPSSESGNPLNLPTREPPDILGKVASALHALEDSIPVFSGLASDETAVPPESGSIQVSSGDDIKVSANETDKNLVSDKERGQLPVLRALTTPASWSLIRPEGTDSSGFHQTDLYAYEKNGGEFHPDLDHPRHPLSQQVGDQNLNLIGGGIFATNAVAAHMAGNYLGTPENTGYVLAVDLGDGVNTLRLGFEAQLNGQKVQINGARTDEMLAGTTPEQFQRTLAEAAANHSAYHISSDKISISVDTFLNIINKAYSALDVPTYRGHPTIEELRASMRALKRDEIETLLIENGGSLTLAQVIALANTYTPEELSSRRDVLNILEDYFSLPSVNTRRKTVPSRLWEEEQPRVRILTIPHTGTTPNYDMVNFVIAHLTLQAGDNRMSHTPGQVQIHGAQLLNEDQIHRLTEFYSRRGVQVLFTADGSITPQQLRVMEGSFAIGYLSKTAVPDVSTAFGTQKTWDLQSSSFGSNTTHSESTGGSNTKTRGGGSSSEGGIILKGPTSRNKQNARTQTTTEDKNIASTTSSDRVHGYVDREFLPTHLLRALAPFELLLVKDGPNRHTKLSLHAQSYYSREISGATSSIIIGPSKADQARALRSQRGSGIFSRRKKHTE